MENQPKHSPKKARKPPIPKLNPEKLLELKRINPNLTTRQLGKLTDADHSSVVKCFQRYGIKTEHLEAFKTNRADILAGIQETVAASFTEADIKGASVRDRTILFGTLYDKERLERGLSTQNSAVILAGAVLEADKMASVHPGDCGCLKCRPAPQDVVNATISDAVLL